MTYWSSQRITFPYSPGIEHAARAHCSCHHRIFISLGSWKYNSETHLLWHSSLDVTKKKKKKKKKPKKPPEVGTTASSPIMEDVTLSHQGAQCEWIWTHSSSEGRWICLVAAGRTRNILSSSFLSLWLRKTSSQRRTAPVKLSKMCCEMGTVYSFSKSDFSTENIEYLTCLWGCKQEGVQINQKGTPA